MNFFKSTLRAVKATGLAAAIASLSASAGYADITLRGASLFDEEHAYTKTLREFEKMIGEAYDGDITFEMHLNGELGDESDFVTFLQQGVAIDYAIMAPSNMAVFAPSIPLIGHAVPVPGSGPLERRPVLGRSETARRRALREG